jgi:hypothetical protein
MMLMKWIFIFSHLSPWLLVSPNDGRPYTLINRVQTDCEMEAITIGSTLAAYFNGFDEEVSLETRLQLDFLSEHLAFKLKSSELHNSGHKVKNSTTIFSFPKIM